jgi:acyl-CoA reductase-like NAD-dependent aldehyde dehydrogenase
MGTIANNGSRSLDFINFSNVINGNLAKTKSTRHSLNPSTLEANPEVPLSTIDDVNEAIGYAKAAAKLWADEPIVKRQQAVIDFANGLLALKDEFATMLTKEQGKPVRNIFSIVIPGV